MSPPADSKIDPRYLNCQVLSTSLSSHYTFGSKSCITFLFLQDDIHHRCRGHFRSFFLVTFHRCPMCCHILRSLVWLVTYHTSMFSFWVRVVFLGWLFVCPFLTRSLESSLCIHLVVVNAPCSILSLGIPFTWQETSVNVWSRRHPRFDQFQNLTGCVVVVYTVCSVL